MCRSPIQNEIASSGSSSSPGAHSKVSNTSLIMCMDLSLWSSLRDLVNLGGASFLLIEYRAALFSDMADELVERFITGGKSLVPFVMVGVLSHRHGVVMESREDRGDFIRFMEPKSGAVMHLRRDFCCCFTGLACEHASSRMIKIDASRKIDWSGGGNNMIFSNRKTKASLEEVSISSL